MRSPPPFCPRRIYPKHTEKAIKRQSRRKEARRILPKPQRRRRKYPARPALFRTSAKRTFRSDSHRRQYSRMRNQQGTHGQKRQFAIYTFTPMFRKAQSIVDFKTPNTPKTSTSIRSSAFKRLFPNHFPTNSDILLSPQQGIWRQSRSLRALGRSIRRQRRKDFRRKSRLYRLFAGISAFRSRKSQL